jgi:alpha-beta hydrolase superfamily lysophospholipase
VIGWSTVGLSAYRMAFEKRADAVVLISPGIAPKFFVGDAAEDKLSLFLFRPVISETSMTRNTFSGEKNPHIDKLKPNNPFLVTFFGLNLLAIASESQDWQISQDIPGIAFLGSADSYVKHDENARTLRSNAPHFEVYSYEGARHELHNEIPEVSEDLFAKTLKFFDSVVGKP